MNRLLLSALALSALLASCGGGGNAGRQPPVVNLASATTARYSETMTITLSGQELDQALTLSSAGCRDFARSAGSTATTAVYTCTVSGVGAQTVTVSGGGITAATVPFTVAVPQVTMVISSNGAALGNIVMTLAPDVTPLTVDNFLAYVKAGFYNGVAFHRHARFSNLGTFVLQAGAYDAPVRADTAFPAHKPERAAIVLERGLSNVRYTVAMARTNAPNSATSEFFINTVDNTFLNPTAAAGTGYAAFATVVVGTTVVDAMVASPCTLSPINFNSPDPLQPPSPDCLPVPNLVILSALQTR